MQTIVLVADGYDKDSPSKYVYFCGTTFKWNELKEDYVRQIEMPADYYAKRYGLSPYDKPVKCYKTVYLKELLELREKQGAKGSMILLTNHYKDGGACMDALLARSIMEEVLRDGSLRN
jgi:hypothetical protein